MTRWLARRLLLMVPTFLGVTLLTFAVMHLAPGDPATVAQGTDISEAAAQRMRQSLGLDASLPAQYLRWLSRIVRLDFGTAWRTGRPVASLILERLPTTLLLSTLALALSCAVAIPAGVHAATRRGKWSERILTWIFFALYALPVPVAATCILLFLGSASFPILPIQGLHSAGATSTHPIVWLLDAGWHLVAPVACLSFGTFALFSRHMQSAMLNVLSDDFVRTARAKGLPERTVIWRHAMRNALLPMVTLMGLALPHLIGGSVIVERIFGIDGMGMLAFRAILERDYDVIMGVTTIAALATLGATLLTDLIYAWIDPRIGVE